MALQAINVEGLSLDKFLEYQVNNNGWTLEKGGQVLSNNHTRTQF
jgi:translation initiation factor 3 subunit K